jgi:hypothetical protein
MKTVTELTAEELALVQAAREKVEQDKLAKQKEINRRVEEQKQTAMKRMLVGEQQVKAVNDFFKDFKSGEFEVVNYPLTKEMGVKDHETGDWHFREDYIVNSAFIQHKEVKTQIRVEEHFVYSSGYRHSSNKGYKMFCYLLDGNRAYSKASTIEEKVLNCINSKKARQTEDEIRESFINDLITTQPIQDAKIDKAYISGNYVPSTNGIKIEYQNGTLVKCTVYVNEGVAILSIHSTEFPKPKVEGETVMDKLNFISKLEF